MNSRRIARVAGIIGVLVLFAASAAASTGALTHIYVDQARGVNAAATLGTEAEPFKSISYAVTTMNQRAAEGLWVLHIKAGVYDADPDKPLVEREFFPIPLRNGMIVQGDDGAENCIISGAHSPDSNSAMFRGENLLNVTIRGLTFRDMVRTGGTQHGGGVELIECSSVTIQDCVFADNSVYGDGGSGFWLSGPGNGVLTVSGNTFSGNYGGGFYVDRDYNGGFSGFIQNNIFRDNVGLHETCGFSIYSKFIGDIVGNVFIGNSPDNYYVTFFIDSFAGDVISNSFSNNSGCFSINTFTGDIVGNIFSEDSTTSIYIGNMEGNIIGNTFNSNIEESLILSSFAGSISNNLFSNNKKSISIYSYSENPKDIIIANNYFVYEKIGINSGTNITITNNTFHNAIGNSNIIELTGNADSSIIRNNIFSALGTAIWEEGEFNTQIADNDFYDIVNALYRNNTPYEKDLAFIKLMVPGFSTNYDWAPGFVGSNVDSGSWSQDAVYDPAINITTLTANKSWAPNQWKGAFVNLSSVADSPLHFPIIENTANQLKVKGNLVAAELVPFGAVFSIDDYRLAAGSSNIDATAGVWGTEDFGGDPRLIGTGGDIGADEFNPGLEPPAITLVDPVATSITATSATLNGRINPNGKETTYHFEYGPTTAYGTTTSPASAGAGESGIAVNAAISALTPETTYHVRLVAENGSGRAQGPDQTFTTFENAKKAIIVAGGGPYTGNFLWPSTKRVASMAYQALIFQGYAGENVRVLSPENMDMDGDAVNDVDADSTWDNLRSAIISWADPSDDLIVFLTDHGGPETFRLNEEEVVNADDLDKWLDAFQESSGAKVLFIYDACQSGSFLKMLAPPLGYERILLASTQSEEPAYFVQEGDISFSSQFWRSVRAGARVKEAYAFSKEAMKDFQTPLVDTDGLDIGGETDESIPIDLVIGAGYDTASSIPVVAGVVEEQVLNGETSATIWANGVSSEAGISEVYAVIVGPEQEQTPATEAVIDLPKLSLEDPGNYGVYEGIYAQFKLEGDYNIHVFAKDKRGSVSTGKLTRVIQNQGDTPQSTVATPVMTPPPGGYDSVQSVEISCATADAAIRYTIDGSEPTETSTPYSAPIPVSATTTIKAGAFKSGWNPSPVVSGTYTIITVVKGDIDGDGDTDLTDAIIGLKVLAGLPTDGQIRDSYAASGADVGGDGLIGFEEVVYLLGKAAGVRD